MATLNIHPSKPATDLPTRAPADPPSRTAQAHLPGKRRHPPRRQHRHLLRAKRAARLCDVSLATWWRWDAAGKIPAGIKISGGTKRWRREELKAWVRARCPDRRTWEAMYHA
jgi:predicted DNA-binding transcriptional regulator AlpA